MGGVNKAILIGHLGRDPEVRTTSSGGRVANFSLATSESWTDKRTGLRNERTEWHRVVAFSEGLVDVVERYLRKGAQVYVEGQLQTREWTDRDGGKRYTTEVVLSPYRGQLQMLDKGGDGDGRRQQGRDEHQAGREDRSAGRSVEDDIPF